MHKFSNHTTILEGREPVGFRSKTNTYEIITRTTPPSSNDRIWCIFRQLRSFKDFVNSRISEMPGAPGKTPGESFRSVFSEGPSHFGSSRKFGNSRDGHSRMGVYNEIPSHSILRLITFLVAPTKQQGFQRMSCYEHVYHNVSRNLPCPFPMWATNTCQPWFSVSCLSQGDQRIVNSGFQPEFD